MHCERAQDHFSDYLEQTLDRPMAVMLEAHLTGCAACRGELESLRLTFRVLGTAPEVDPPWDGAWQVMARVQAARQARLEAERRRPAYVLLLMLRSLSPARTAMAAGMATLIVAGTLLVPGVSDHVRNFIWPVAPGAPAPVVHGPVTVAPAVRVSYGPLTPAGQEVSLWLTPAAEMANARVRVLRSGTPFQWPGVALSPARPLEVKVPVASDGRAAETVRLSIEDADGGRSYDYLVALPLAGRRSQPVTLVFDALPLEPALRQLAPYLDRPVVVEEPGDAGVRLGVEGAQPLACLRSLAAQAGMTVSQERDVYRLTAAR